jgi:hypothetical protein
MKRYLAIASCVTIVALSGLAAGSGQTAGKVSGKLTVSGKATALTNVYVVEKESKLRIFLSDQPLGEQELFDSDALSDAVGEKGVSAVMIQLDDARKAQQAFFFHSELPAGLAVRELTRFTATTSTDSRLAGRVVFNDRGFSFGFDATFDAPVLLQLTKQTPLPPGASSADVARKRLEQREVKFTEDAYRSAVIDGNAELVKLFLDGGMPPDTERALESAIDVKATEVVKLLVAAGANVNARKEYKESMLLGACSSGVPEIVKILIDAGADVNAPNEYSARPLDVAAEQGQLEMVKMLLAAGAKVNARNPYGGTALQVAVLRGYKEIVKTLIDAGADVKRDLKDLLDLGKDPEIRKVLQDAAKAKK